MAKDEEPREERVVRCSDGRLRQCKARRTGWTARKRRIFLDHLAATSNATASAREAGMNVRSAFALRARDPQFAAEWDEALRHADARLKGKLIVYAETQGAAPVRDGNGQSEESDIAGFDPKLALQMLAQREGVADSRRLGRRGGPRPRTATEEETDAEIVQLLKVLKKRHDRRAGETLRQ